MWTHSKGFSLFSWGPFLKNCTVSLRNGRDKTSIFLQNGTLKHLEMMTRPRNRCSEIHTMNVYQPICQFLIVPIYKLTMVASWNMSSMDYERRMIDKFQSSFENYSQLKRFSEQEVKSVRYRLTDQERNVKSPAPILLPLSPFYP